MKTYEAFYEPHKNKGVYGISLVENPAMEGLFIALSKDEVIQFKEVDKEQRILTGLALEPNKPVYRNQNGEEFNIVFSEATVKDLAFGFLKNGYQKNSSVEHDKVIAGVTFTESWIIEDATNDKAHALGFSYPKGSWMVTMKVDDDAIWNDFIKTGKVQGFSIDAMLSLKEVNLKSDITMSKENEKTLLQKIEELPEIIMALFKTKQEEIKLGEIKTGDGNVTIMFDGDTMQVGGKVWILAEDKTEVPLPIGDYELEGGQILVVTEEGVIGEVKDVATTEETQTAEQKPAEMTAKETDATAKAIENAIKSIMIKYDADSKESNKAELEKIKTELKADFEKQILELSNQPASKPIKSTPQQKEPTTSRERILETIQTQN